jgi:hypothetical protein
LVLADQPQGELVVVIGAFLADLAVGDRQAMAGLSAVGRAFLLAGQCPLRAGKPPLGGAQVPRVGDGLDGAVAGGDRGEDDQAKIDPGGACYRWQRGRVAVDHEGGVVAAVRFTDDGDAGRHRWQLAGPAHAHLADLGEVQPARVEREAVAGEPDRLATALGPVPRAADPAALALPDSELKPDDYRRGRHVSRRSTCIWSS